MNPSDTLWSNPEPNKHKNHLMHANSRKAWNEIDMSKRERLGDFGMSGSKIEWTEQTWEVTAGCTRVSEGCRNCYAEKLVGSRFFGMAERRLADGVANGSTIDMSLKVINPKTKKWNGRVELLSMNLDQPLKRKKPTVYFVNSRSDLFHPDVPFGFIDRVFAVMALCPDHRFQVLTKRPERMAEYFEQKGLGLDVRIQDAARFHFKKDLSCTIPLPNVWLGTSVEDQAAADERVPHLLACPVGDRAGRFLSCEPLIGEVDLESISIICENTNEPFYFNALSDSLARGLWFGDEDEKSRKVSYIIVGGESGPIDDVRICRLEWFRSIKDQCEESGVPFYMKQTGMRCFDFDDPRAPCKETKVGTGKGNDPSKWPDDLRVRQIPDGLTIGDKGSDAGGVWDGKFEMGR